MRNSLTAIQLLADELGYVVEYEIHRKGEGTNQMAESMNIEVKEGESLVEAMLRVAKDTAKSNPHLTEAGLRKIEKVGKPAAPKSDSRSPKRKSSVPASSLGGDPNEGLDQADPDIYSAIHVYQRNGETEGKVRWNANHEREMHGPNTLVFCHLHSFGGKCDSGCTVKVHSED